jgi:hypothetical protein
MTKTNRAAILAFTDGERVRITRNGEVHAYGVLPNTNHTGWYLAGFADHILDIIARCAA